MPDPAAELNAFIDRVAPMIASDATYWFTDGSYCGVVKIAAAISQTFHAIQDETYKTANLSGST